MEKHKMYGSSYVTVVGYIGDGFALCRPCADKANEAGDENTLGAGWTPIYQHEADEYLNESSPVNGLCVDYCDDCSEPIGVTQDEITETLASLERAAWEANRRKLVKTLDTIAAIQAVHALDAAFTAEARPRLRRLDKLERASARARESLTRDRD